MRHYKCSIATRTPPAANVVADDVLPVGYLRHASGYPVENIQADLQDLASDTQNVLFAVQIPRISWDQLTLIFRGCAKLNR